MKNIILIILFFSSILLAEEYAVISNQNMKNLSTNQIKAIFLKKLTYVEDLKIIPINLEVRDSIRLNFQKHILHMNFSRLKKYWTKQHYLGHRPPVSMKSQESIKSFVKKVDGSIGYINIKNIDESVKIIYRWKD